MTTLEKTPQQATPTDPNIGMLTLDVAGTIVDLTEIEWWVDPDGTFVVRSREFDCFAQDRSRDRAVSLFVEEVFDYGEMLADLIKSGEAVEEEREAFTKLSARLSEVYLAQQKHRRRDSRSKLLRLLGSRRSEAAHIARGSTQ